MKRHLYTIVLATALTAGQSVCAQAPDPNPARFAETIQAFESWDSKNAFPDDGILFVGSSSVRLWPTAEAFPGKPIINRGFGGSELSDVIHYYDQVIWRYTPRTIFLYAGDNDIASGKSPDQVFEDYIELVERLKADLPDTEMIFISIKPSKDRWSMWPEMQETNQMVRQYAEGDDSLGYVDLATPLLDSSGQPRNVYLDDGLHLNAEGYSIWQEALAPLLD